MGLVGIILLILVGILLILLEILVIPGVTISGIAGLIFIGGGIYTAYQISITMGNMVLVGSLAFVVFTIVYSLRAGTWKKLRLDAEIDSKVNVIETETIAKGDVGITVSRLAPIGKVLINNVYFEARAKNKLIDQEKEIIVLKIEGNKIIVDEHIKSEAEN